MLVLEPKGPAEVIFYDFDWATRRLAPGEQIVDAGWEVISGSVEIAPSPPSSFDAGVCRGYLQGGELGETCVISNWVETNLNPRRDLAGKVKIKQK